MKANDTTIKWGKKEYFKSIASFVFNTLVLIVFLAIGLFFKQGSLKAFLDFVISGVDTILFILLAIVATSVGLYLYLFHQNRKFLLKTSNVNMLFLAVLVSVIASYAFGKINLFLYVLPKTF